MSTTVFLNRREAAELSGLTPNAVKNALDKGIVPSRDAADGIDARDVASLVLLRYLGPLGVRDKRRVREWLVNDRRRRFQLTEALVVERTEDVQRMAREARRYAELRDKWIVVDPMIRGGDPVIKGSRVSVYTLADRVGHGEPDAVLDDDFPHIPKEAREVAVRYARTHPRRGRPRRRGRPA